MPPLLPKFEQSGGKGPRRGSVYWADPHFPDGRSKSEHRCLLLRTPRRRGENIPILTLHSPEKKLDAVSDCCLELDPSDYPRLKKRSVIDARMTMFLPSTMLRSYCFDLRDDDLTELEDCLFEALDMAGMES